MVALQNTKIVDISLEDALANPKRVDLNCDAIQTARDLGISFGDRPVLG
jgi:6-phosphofructokinase 1